MESLFWRPRAPLSVLLASTDVVSAALAAINGAEKSSSSDFSRSRAVT